MKLIAAVCAFLFMTFIGVSVVHAHDLGIISTKFQLLVSDSEFSEYQLSAFVSDTQRYRISDISIPKHCQIHSTPHTSASNDVVSFQFRCQPSLSINDVLTLPWQVSGILMHSGLNATNGGQLVLPKNGSIRVPMMLLTGSTGSTTDKASHYLKLGIEHILQGYDHLLFVAMMLILVVHIKNVIKVITAFTLAHSITLSAAFLEFIHLPIGAVEASIALSIMYLTVLYFRQNQPLTNTEIKKDHLKIIILPALFGLLHGFGFASALGELEVPRSDVFIALLTFNIGVEVGQILFVGIASLAAVIAKSLCSLKLLNFVRAGIVFLIGSVSTFWFLERATGVIGNAWTI
jgi:hypothetical protein